MSSSRLDAGIEPPAEKVGHQFAVHGWLTGTTTLEGCTVRIAGSPAGLSLAPDQGADRATLRWTARPSTPVPPGRQAVELVGPNLRTLAVGYVDVGGEDEPLGLLELDHPLPEATVEGDVLPVRGWALLDGCAPSAVDLLVDGAARARARIRIPRADVAEALPDFPDAGTSGFEATVPLDLPPGTEHRLSVRVRIRNHLTGEWTSPARFCTVRVPDRDAEDESLAAELSGRSRALLDRVAGPADPRHVLVFAHSLRLGGGQLWLQELLTGLVRQHGWTATVISPMDGPLRQDCMDLGVPVHLTSPYAVDTVPGYEGQVAELALLARSTGAGVALVNTLSAFPGADAAARAGLPVAWAVHESFPLSTFAYEHWQPSGVNPTVRARWERLLGTTEHLLFVADSTREMFARYAAPQRTRTVRYGTPMVRFGGHTSDRAKREARRALGLPEDGLIVLNVGIMEPRKGQVGLIAAMDRVRWARPDVLLTVVGHHPSEYSLATSDLVAAKGLEHWVNLVELQRDPVPWFRAADLFVNSSDIESLPRSILEAVCCGLPVVASDVFGAREVITDGHSGWLFEPNDVDALTVALLRALETPAERRREMAAEAYQALAGWLDPAGYVTEYSGVLAELSKGEGKP
ncbi:glycosyltransferase family 4 protein [Amycolatopsis cihanbeyliensis]|nr:glycosyltransferase family 4 protein [Amycolatopsis cihanbeyliensis]